MEGGEPGNTGNAVRYRGDGYVRPWIWWAWYAGTLGIGLLAATSGFPEWLAGAIVFVSAIEWGRRTTIHEITLVGDRVVLCTDAGGRSELALSEIAAFRTSRWRGARLLTTDGRKRRLRASGALAPLLDAIRAQRPDLDDRTIYQAAERSARTERRMAERRHRHPWITRLTVILTVLGLALLLAGFGLTIADRDDIIGRAVLVEVSVLDVHEDDDRQDVTIAYVDPAGRHRETTLAVTGLDWQRRTMVVAMDPEHPATVWSPGDTPTVVPDAALWLLIVAGVLLLVSMLMAPTAFAEVPELEEVDPGDV